MTSEQRALIEKAERSIQAARLLATEDLHEFAVSRAYYAMFYVAEALLLNEGLAFSKHSAVIAAFGREYVKSGRIPAEYHANLREAQDQRNLGDYGTGATIAAEEAGKQIRRADAFLSMGRDMLQ